MRPHLGRQNIDYSIDYFLRLTDNRGANFKLKCVFSQMANTSIKHFVVYFVSQQCRAKAVKTAELQTFNVCPCETQIGL